MRHGKCLFSPIILAHLIGVIFFFFFLAYTGDPAPLHQEKVKCKARGSSEGPVLTGATTMVSHWCLQCLRRFFLTHDLLTGLSLQV